MPIFSYLHASRNHPDRKHLPGTPLMIFDERINIQGVLKSPAKLPKNL
jgi:hypothetical protein